ncbi:unnamed protein product [Trifolium pratense]|uniref:Uncharacterized protein n=1 Tax=Trifolium pratense TaxID=57577 RepID=A0ACB0LWT3_TRIPR|nr:unnamed protein product [Trifolium pratense]
MDLASLVRFMETDSSVAGFHFYLRWCYDYLSSTTSTVVVGEIADLTDVVLIYHPSRSPSVSPACLRRCSLRLSFLFLAVLFVPPVAGKPKEDDNE